MMNGRTIGASLVLVASFAAGTARADSQGDRIREALAKLEPALVRVAFNTEVAKTNVRLMLEDGTGGTRETEGEGSCIGLVVNDSGLVLIGGQVFPDPYSRSMFAGMGFTGEASSPPKNFRVALESGEFLPAELVARDEDLNVAYLQVDSPPASWKPVSFAKNASLRIGDPFMVVNFLDKKADYQRSFTTGRVTGVVKGSVPRFLQNGISPGGLGGADGIGGPVVALDTGEVVGVIAAPRKEPPKGPQSTGLNANKTHGAVMSIGIQVVVPQILMAAALEPGIRNPVAVAGEKGWIGIEEFQPLSDAIAKTFEREPGAGAIVSLVGDDSPAARAGVELEDLLVTIDGEPVAAKDETAVQDLRRRIRKSAIGSTLVLGLERNGKAIELPVVVAAAPKSVYEAETYNDDVFGVTVKEITYDVVQRKNFDAADLGGVLVHKVPLAGLFSIAGLQPDDIILGVNDAAVKDVASFKTAMEKMKKERKKEVVVKVKRGSDTRFQKVKPDWN